jgi:hypothetical protein
VHPCKHAAKRECYRNVTADVRSGFVVAQLINHRLHSFGGELSNVLNKLETVVDVFGVSSRGHRFPLFLGAESYSHHAKKDKQKSLTSYAAVAEPPRKSCRPFNALAKRRSPAYRE